MKRTIGISRNKFEVFQLAKGGLARRKNIFKIVGKEEQLSEDSSQNTNHLLSATTKNSVNSSEAEDTVISLEIYEKAKDHLHQVAEYPNKGKKMTSEIKMRMASFKDSEIKLYDDNISKFSAKAVDHLLKSEKILCLVRGIKGISDVQEKFYRNMEKSLGLEIREVSRSLRIQEKEYYDRLRAYESGAANLAIQLCQQDRKKMKDEFQDMEVCQTQMGEDAERNKQITDLVKSINQLSSVYKQLNELVIDQGSLIDRIDFNIQETCGHVERGVEHLKGADDKASSPAAQKCMCFLIICILAMACVIGFKLAK